MTTTIARDTTTPVSPPGPPSRNDSSSRWWLTALALVAWGALVVVSAVWGEHVTEVGHNLGLAAPPLHGTWDWRFGRDAFAAVLVALGVVVVGPRLASGLGWTRLLWTVALGSIAWAVALAVVDGWGGLTDPLLGQYIRTVPKVGDPFTFLSHFTERIATYDIHTQGHPPGMVLVLWALNRIGLYDLRFYAVLVFAGGAAAAVAALVAVRELAGEERARAVAPFMVVVPAAIWWTSGDAFFSGVVAWGITLVVLAIGRTGRRADVLALAGGLLFGIAAFLSYGLVLLAVIPIVVAIARRRFRPLMLAGVGAVPVFLVFAAVGFWWISGLEATRVRYFAGIASRRPYSYFVVGDLGAFALAVGPAVAVGLVWLRDRAVWLLVGGALLAVLLADVSGMSKAEVERIWLPFVPWVILATAAFATMRCGSRSVRLWLGLQAASGLLIEVAVRSPW